MEIVEPKTTNSEIKWHCMDLVPRQRLNRVKFKVDQ